MCFAAVAFACVFGACWLVVLVGGVCWLVFALCWLGLVGLRGWFGTCYLWVGDGGGFACELLFLCEVCF